VEKLAEPPTNRPKSAKFAPYAARSIPLPETSYTAPVGIDIRIRHYHRTQARRVMEFVVQLEIEIRNEWKPVIGYDSAHGFAHIDRYNLRGRARKERLELSFSEALTRAERDIKQNWSIYRERFSERRMAMKPAEKKMVEKNLDLLFEFEKYVLEHPEIAENIPRDAVVFMK